MDLLADRVEGEASEVQAVVAAPASPSAPALIDELVARRPDFVPGTGVELADGQVWQFRRPLVSFAPDDESETGWRACLEINPPDDYQAQLTRLMDLYEDPSATMSDLIKAEAAIGKRLLLANYNLTNEQVISILRFGYDEAGNPRAHGIRVAVLDIARGSGPKAQPATGE